MNDAKPWTKLKSLWPIAFAGLFMLCGILVLVYLGRDRARLMNGPLGDFDLAPLIGVDSSPSIEQLQGKVAVFHFWGTWCPDCRQEFEELNALFNKYAANPDVVFISVSCSPGREADLEELRTQTKAFLESYQSSMPVYADPALYTRGRLTKMLAAGGFGYPFTMVVDRQGIVRDYWLVAEPNRLALADQTIEKNLGESKPN